MEFVHEQDGTAVPDQFFQQVFESLLKIAAVFCACHKAGHIQCQQAAPLERAWYTVSGNALGKTLCQRRLANARLPHQTGVVFLTAA